MMLEPNPRSVKVVLVGALALISSPDAWCQKVASQTASGGKTHSTSNTAAKWCAVGAIWKSVEDNFPEKGEEAAEAGNWALRFLEKAMTGKVTMDPKKFWLNESVTEVLEYNDSHPHGQVVTAFEKAIAKITI